MIFEYGQYRVEYEQWGSGPQVLLAFHGFGQLPTVFYNLEASLTSRFTVYSLALFHHGKSCYPPDRSPDDPLTPNEFRDLMDAFRAYIHADRCSLMGYSLGGRLMLQYMQQRPDKIITLILLAPDGIKKSFWYHFATQNPRGKRLFRRMVQRPRLFFRLVKYFRMMGFLNAKMEKFIGSQFGDEANRRKVFNVWNTYSLLVPRVGRSREVIREYRIPTVIFTGTYDPVLNNMIGKILVDGMEPWVHWHPIKAGHDLLKESYNDHIYPVLKQHIFPHLG